MADSEDKDLELDVNKAKGSKMTNILLITLIIVVLVVGGVVAFLFTGSDDGESAPGSENEAAKAIENKDPLFYITLVPEFVVNFGPGSEVRYLQIDVQAASRKPDAFEVMNTYMPVIRNDVLVLLSGQSFDVLRTRAGKELIQRRILNTINTVVNSVLAKEKAKENDNKENSGNQESEKRVELDPDAIVAGPIESVYFLSFIMQ